MASGIRTSMKMEGLEGLRIRFRRLPVNIQEKELANAVMKGARVIRDEAKALAPVLREPSPFRLPGTVRNAIRSTRGVRKDSEAAAFVSVRQLTKRAIEKFKKSMAGKIKNLTGANNPRDPFYWRFLEFGTSKMAARPFLRPAFESKKEAAARVIAEELRRGVDRQAAELARTVK